MSAHATPLTAIDRDKYVDLARRVLPRAQALVLLTPDAAPLWCDERAGELGLHEALQQVSSQQAPSQVLAVHTASWQGSLYAQRLYNDAETLIATLVAVVPPSDPDLDDATAAGLALIARLLREEFQLHAELQSMADELGMRYEELNLVYDTEDQIADFDEQENVLRQLVANCVEYLDVDLAVLIVPSKCITLHHAHRRFPAPRVPMLVRELEQSCFARVVAGGADIVINGKADAERSQVPLFLDKLMAIRVLIGSRVDGILVAVNGMQKADFSNSDRSILDVLARKASKIIQTNYDSRTGLMKRAGFEHHLGNALNGARHQGREFSVLNVDIDRLQVINDVDHNAGDSLIAEVAACLRRLLRDSDVIAALGGGRFGVLLQNCPMHVGERVAEKLRAGVNDLAFTWDGHAFEISASVGVAALTAENHTIDELITAVEMATNLAKERGRNRVHLYDTEDHNLRRRRDDIGWVGRIQQTLRDDRLVLFAQPIAPLFDSREHGHWEILLRMEDEQGAIIAPGAFMPAAERYQLMSAIDRWVVRATLDALSARQHSLGGTTFAINLSGQSLGDEGFLAYVTAELERTGIAPGMLCFEVTETAAVENLEAAQRFIAAVRELGGRFSLDDFGTGVSSFGYLKMLEVDFLKIDGSFVKDMHRDAVSRAMVAAIHQVGRVVGTRTIAEFVENEEICDVLREIGVDYAQGYGIGKPRPLREELAQFCERLPTHALGGGG